MYLTYLTLMSQVHYFHILEYNNPYQRLWFSCGRIVGCIKGLKVKIGNFKMSGIFVVVFFICQLPMCDTNDLLENLIYKSNKDPNIYKKLPGWQLGYIRNSEKSFCILLSAPVQTMIKSYQLDLVRISLLIALHHHTNYGISLILICSCSCHQWQRED